VESCKVSGLTRWCARLVVIRIPLYSSLHYQNLDDTSLQFGPSIADVSDTQLFYMGGLDPTQDHSITIIDGNTDGTGMTNGHGMGNGGSGISHRGVNNGVGGTKGGARMKGPMGSTFAFHSITVWQLSAGSNTSSEHSPPASTTPTAKHSNIAKIVVPIVVVIAALILFAIAWFYVRRRRLLRATAAPTDSEAVPALVDIRHSPSFIDRNENTLVSASPQVRSRMGMSMPRAIQISDANWVQHGSLSHEVAEALASTEAASRADYRPASAVSFRQPSLGDRLAKIIELLPQRRGKDGSGGSELSSPSSFAGVAT